MVSLFVVVQTSHKAPQTTSMLVEGDLHSLFGKLCSSLRLLRMTSDMDLNDGVCNCV